ncbi:MAG: (deoxy)nucleoside triphosphate pyrophosphohydrolase [Deltaproteobacteria bacterium]|nr:(deoxy)nucleoside triphosphate pyrophosphohydrolase [Deltaproteobacteria bacterium]
MTETSFKTVVVSAAVIFRDDTVLLTQRPAGTHLANLWEFPGGKVEPNEDPRDALARELREELGVDTTVHQILECTFWRYPNKNVLLLFFETALAPDVEPQHLGVSAHVWATRDTLAQYAMPPADEPVLAVVQAQLTQRSALRNT